MCFFLVTPITANGLNATLEPKLRLTVSSQYSHLCHSMKNVIGVSIKTRFSSSIANVIIAVIEVTSILILGLGFIIAITSSAVMVVCAKPDEGKLR